MFALGLEATLVEVQTDDFDITDNSDLTKSGGVLSLRINEAKSRRKWKSFTKVLSKHERQFSVLTDTRSITDASL